MEGLILYAGDNSAGKGGGGFGDESDGIYNARCVLLFSPFSRYFVPVLAVNYSTWCQFGR